MIHEFHFEIYPRRLWITYDASVKELDEMFPADPNDPEQKSFEPIEDCHDAITYAVVDNRNLGGFLIRFANLQAINFRNVSHESDHVAHKLMEFVGILPDLINDEPEAYIVGWVANCCEEVKDFDREKWLASTDKGKIKAELERRLTNLSQLESDQQSKEFFETKPKTELLKDLIKFVDEV